MLGRLDLAGGARFCSACTSSVASVSRTCVFTNGPWEADLGENSPPLGPRVLVRRHWSGVAYARTYKRRMPCPGRFRSLPLLTLGLGLLFSTSGSAEQPALNKAPTVADWVRLSKRPDWSGVWNPNISDQNAQIKTNPVPWKPEVEARINQLTAEERQGDRRDCSWTACRRQCCRGLISQALRTRRLA